MITRNMPRTQQSGANLMELNKNMDSDLPCSLQPRNKWLSSIARMVTDQLLASTSSLTGLLKNTRICSVTSQHKRPSLRLKSLTIPIWLLPSTGSPRVLWTRSRTRVVVVHAGPSQRLVQLKLPCSSRQASLILTPSNSLSIVKRWAMAAKVVVSIHLSNTPKLNHLWWKATTLTKECRVDADISKVKATVRSQPSRESRETIYPNSKLPLASSQSQ